MSNKSLFLIITLLLLVKYVSLKSLTLVVDTTASMEDEIGTIKNHISSLSRYMKNSTNFDDYILISFNDQEFVSTLMMQSVDVFVEAVSSLKASGGRECPENSLAGIEKALEMSQSNSIIILFTDAYSKSRTEYKAIENLCRTTHSQVIIFLSGSCTYDSSNPGYVDVYYDIAQVCSGLLFWIDAYNLRKVFRYIKEIVITEYNDVINFEEFTGHKQFPFSADSFTTSALIAMSCEYPTLQVVDSTGRSPVIEKLLDTNQSLVVRLSNLKTGEYHISVSCQGTVQLKIYKRNYMPFEYGFSPVLPYSVKETSQRPIPGRNSFIYIKLMDDQYIELNSLMIEYVKDNEIKNLSLQQRQDIGGCYFADIFVEPAKPFILTITGMDLLKNETVSGSTKIINPQTAFAETAWIAPRLEIIPPESDMIDYLTNTTIACKIVGYPKPTIWWEDVEKTQLLSNDVLIEIPSTYISYVKIENMTSNYTLFCKAKNTIAESTSKIKLYVNRPFTFEFIQEPKDDNIEYGSSGMIYCEVDAYPHAEIKWLFNGTAIEYFENIELLSEENAIKIKNMTLNDIGTYTCEAYNYVNTERISANISISGLELPNVEAQAQVFVKPGDWTEIECRIIEGNPTPTLSWKYKSDNDFEFQSLPSDVYAKYNKLKISVVTLEHKGIYKCIATNMLGIDSAEIFVGIEYAPKILDSHNDTIVIKEGEIVELPCQTDAIPEATVKWELYQDDVFVPFESRHITTEDNTHRFTALWKDSGSYHCIAENNVGRTEKTINVNVLVPPYIKPAEEQVVVAEPESDVILPCIVLYGNPVPSTEWLFIGHDSSAVILTRSSANTFLTLHAVNKDDEGLYLCVANNIIGNDRIRIQLIVQ